MTIPKMCLKQSFSHSNWVLQEIMSLSVLLNCISGSWNFETAFLADCSKSCCFFMLLDRKFNDDSKNVLKTIIFSLQAGFTSDFVSDCRFKLCLLSVQILTLRLSLTVLNLVMFFYVIR